MNNWRQGWAVIVKSRRRGTPHYITRYFRQRVLFWGWSQPRNEVIKAIVFGP